MYRRYLGWVYWLAASVAALAIFSEVPEKFQHEFAFLLFALALALASWKFKSQLRQSRARGTLRWKSVRWGFFAGVSLIVASPVWSVCTLLSFPHAQPLFQLYFSIIPGVVGFCLGGFVIITQIAAWGLSASGLFGLMNSDDQ